MSTPGEAIGGCTSEEGHRTRAPEHGLADAQLPEFGKDGRDTPSSSQGACQGDVSLGRTL